MLLHLEQMIDAIIGRLTYNDGHNRKFRATVLIKAEHYDGFYKALAERLSERYGIFCDNIPDLLERTTRGHVITVQCKPQPADHDDWFQIYNVNRADVLYVEQD